MKANLVLFLALLGTSVPALAGGTVPPPAIPEPGTLVLMGVGAAALGAVGWWRSKK